VTRTCHNTTHHSKAPHHSSRLPSPHLTSPPLPLLPPRSDKAIYTQNKPGNTEEGAIRNAAAIHARDKEPARFLAETIDAGSAIAGCAAIGFKFFPEHARDQAFFEALLADQRIRKIILRRENRLACVTSIVRASVTGDYIRVSSDQVPVHITPADLQAWTECYDAYYGFLRDRLVGQDYVELTYESLGVNAEQALRPVYELLGLPPHSAPAALPGDLAPQSSGKLHNALVNFDELRDAFATTERAIDYI